MSVRIVCTSLHGVSIIGFIPKDFDECSVEPDVCGSLGTCTNNDGGLFYECDCRDGAVTTGSNSDGSLTCVGEFHNFHLPLSIESLLSTRYQ